MPLSVSTSFDVPGVYVSESVFGVIPASLASHSSVYMLGHSSKPSSPVGTPYFIQSPDDFFNVFGVSSSTNSIRLFFEQRSGSGIYFVNVPAKATSQIAITTVVVGTTYTATVDGFEVSYTAATGDTAQDIYAKLQDAINKQLSHIAYMTGDTIRHQGVTVAGSTGLTVTDSVAPAYPKVQDVLATISTAFDPEMRQGFLIAPEFFQNFSILTDRQLLANSLEAHCADPEFNWVAIADCGETTATSTTGGGAVASAIVERGGLTSPKGHMAYYFPYWKNATDQLVPMSASVVGVALRRYRAEGYRQPPAGTRYPVYGVKDTSFPITDKIQAQLNPLGINCGRKLPAGKGTVVYGARTVSTSPFYRFVTVRVILNVLAGTLANAYPDVVFSSVDGIGALFSQLRLTAVDVCERLRQAGALYGATPEEAYLVVCDSSNNPAIDLESGIVSLDVIAKPSPILEVLSIRVSRASIGSVLAEVQSAGDTGVVSNPGATETVGSSTSPKQP